MAKESNRESNINNEKGVLIGLKSEKAPIFLSQRNISQHNVNFLVIGKPGRGLGFR